MKRMEIDEQILSSWLRLSVCVRNDRLVKSMSFNEIFVCNILYNTLSGQEISAKDIVSRTGMLKSQVNKVLTDLEKKGFISKQVSESDKRKSLLTLTDKGNSAYQKEHRQILLIIEKLRIKVGDDEMTRASFMFNELSEAMQNIDI